MAGIPKDLVPVSQGIPNDLVAANAPPPSDLQQSPQAARSYDPQTVAQMWKDNGGDPKVAEMMGHISFSESAGNPGAINPEGTGVGLFQINPKAHGKGDWTDPSTNIKQAIALYNARKKAGQTGFEDWADSMDKGADGGWGAHLMDYVQQTTPMNHTPLPPGTVKQNGKPVNKNPLMGNYNVIEQFAGHQDLPFMLFNAYVMDGFKVGGLHSQQVMDYWKPGFLGGKNNPAAVDALYGPNAPAVLKAYAASGNPWLANYAKMLQGNGWAAGAATFAEEWFNPMSWAEGATIGKGLGLSAGLIAKIPGAEKFISNTMHLLSSYRGVVAEHGEGPRNLLAAVGQRMSARDSDAHNKMMDVFGDTTEAEQEEIRRRQQRLTPKDFGARNDELDRRATLARDYTRAMTAEKLATNSIKKSQVAGVKPAMKHMVPVGGMNSGHSILEGFYDDGTPHEVGDPVPLKHNGKTVGKFDFDPGTYVGLAGQYNHPNSAYNNLMTEVAGARSAGAGIASSASLKHKVYDNIDAAKSAKDDVGERLMRGDIDHAQIFKDFLSTGGKRVEFEKGMRELSEAHPDVIKVPTSKQEAQQMLSSGKYIPIKDVKTSKIDMSGDAASPFMKQAMISQSFQKFLTDKNSLSSILGTSIAERGGGNPLERWGNGFNQAYRAMIVANPGFHPFWNVAPNATAAGQAGKGILAGPHGLVDGILNQTRAMLGAGATVSHAMGLIPIAGGAFKPVTRTLDAMREGLEYPFLHGAQDWQDSIHKSLAAMEAESAHYGAHAEFGATRPVLGGNAGRVSTLRTGRDPVTGKLTGLNSREMIDRMLTRVDNWNKEGTFGMRGERAFSTTLFAQLTRKGGKFEGDPYGAAWAVREALGNYRNISPENPMSKIIMFFPWLASNVPFWFRALTKAPQMIDAGTEGSRMQRENAGDPTAYQSNYPKLGLSTYEGGSTREIPLPFNSMEHFVQSAYDMVSGQMDQGLQIGAGEVANRMKPGYGAAVNTALTHYDQRANPAGTYAGYNVMYDKDLPDTQKYLDLAKQLGATALPLPVPFVTRDIIQNGYDPQQMSGYIQEALGMGYINTSQANAYKRQMEKPQAFVQRRATHFAKVMAGPNPMTEDQQSNYKDQTSKVYANKVKQIKAAIDRQKAKDALSNVPTNLAPVSIPSDLVPVGR